MSQMDKEKEEKEEAEKAKAKFGMTKMKRQQMLHAEQLAKKKRGLPRPVLSKAAAAIELERMLERSFDKKLHSEAVGGGLLEPLIRMTVKCECGYCADLRHPINTEEEREAGVWCLHALATKQENARECFAVLAPTMRHPEATGFDHIMIMLLGDGSTERARNGAAAVMSCLAICSSLPAPFNGTKWRADTIPPLMDLLRHSGSRETRQLCARAIELQILDQEGRQRRAKERNLRFHNCAQIVAGYLGIGVDWTDRIAMRKGLQGLVQR